MQSNSSSLLVKRTWLHIMSYHQPMYPLSHLTLPEWTSVRPLKAMFGVQVELSAS